MKPAIPVFALVFAFASVRLVNLQEPAPLPPPATIFYTDLLSGPNTGGEGNAGVYVTVSGTDFGAAQGDSSVTVGGGAAANYKLWSDTRIVLQPGAGAATGEIVVHTAGGASNGVPFTVRPGNIYFVANGGSDGNPGTMDQPFATLSYAAGQLQPGDTLYARGGTYNEAVYLGNSGTADAPIAVAGYPGETAVVDGQYRIPEDNYGALVQVAGSYNIVSELTIQNSNGLGLFLDAPYAQATRITAQLNLENGILASGNYDLVQGCDVYYNARSNEYGSRRRRYWSSGLSAARHPSYAVLRRNRVWNNWGEGLSTYEADHTTMEDNVVYDNWSANAYLSDTQFSKFQRNLVYSTPGNACQSGDQPGIAVADETQRPPSAENTIVNNLVMGNKVNFYWWSNIAGSGLVHDLIAYNTFVNSTQDGSIRIDAGSHSDTRFENNIILQEGELQIAGVFASKGIRFAFNNWSQSPPPALSGTGDQIGDPKLAKAGPTGPGELTAYWFMPCADSPAISKARALSNVPEDFLGNARGSQTDIGALQFSRP